jgi:hypothetical protein
VMFVLLAVLLRNRERGGKVFTPEQQATMGAAIVPLVLVLVAWATSRMQTELKELRKDNERFEKRNSFADKDLQEVKANVRTLTNGRSVHHAEEAEKTE